MPAPLPFLAYGNVLGIPMPILITGVFFVFMAFVLSFSLGLDQLWLITISYCLMRLSPTSFHLFHSTLPFHDIHI